MKRFLLALFVLASLAAPVVVMAATCKDSSGTVSGDVCGHVDGECICYDKPKV